MRGVVVGRDYSWQNKTAGICPAERQRSEVISDDRTRVQLALGARPRVSREDCWRAWQGPLL